jgi:parallel beta-helix repeat protein
MILLLGSLAGFRSISVECVQDQGDPSHEMTPSSYVQHEPIAITNDTALAYYAVSGTGDAAVPYILEGWNITTSAESYGIYIGFTTKYFILRDCWVHGAMNDAYRGVLIHSVASGTAVIERVHCESWSAGIEVSSSPEAMVRGCSVNDCNYGFMMTSSNNCTVFNNTAFENDNWGIWTSSPSCTVANNTLWGNVHGLQVYHADNVLVENNTLSNDGFNFLFDTVADYKTIIEHNNLVNGFPISLLINEVGTVYDGGIGQAILINCTNVKLINQNLSYCETGAFLRWCTDCQVADCHLSWNDDSGLYAFYSDNIFIKKATVIGNDMYGFQLTHSTANITDCDVEENKQGVGLVGSVGTVSIQNNRFASSIEYAVSMNGQWNMSVTDNTFTDDGVFCQSSAMEDYERFLNNVTGNLVNGKPLVFYCSFQNQTISGPFGQIFLANCTNVELNSLDCSHTAIGIGISLCKDCRVIDSDCSYAKTKGITIVKSNSTIVQNTVCDHSGGHGISDMQSINTSLIHNWCRYDQCGICCSSTQSTFLNGNIVTDSSNYGIFLLSSYDTRLDNNVCNQSLGDGVFVEMQTGLTMINNTCSSNGHSGISTWDSSDILLYSNDCEQNLFSGVYMGSSWSGIISSNRLVDNRGGGLYISGGFNFDMVRNTIMRNDNQGILMGGSNCIFRNNIIALNEEYGIYLYPGNNVSLHHNTFVNNNAGGIQAYDSGLHPNLWYEPSTAEGNYWSDWIGHGPYYIGGSSGSWDMYPLGETDSDSDTLHDSWEIAHGLNPYSPDSDGDSLPDAWEVMYGLNPILNDTAGDHDGDGLSNLEEFLLGLNPSSEDSDGDQMPDLWEVQNYLNPLYNDAGFDPDGDDISNLYEFYGGTNPHVYDGSSTSTTTTIIVTTGTSGDMLLLATGAVAGFCIAIVLIILAQMFVKRRGAS